jgi:hypothetical protein
MKFTIIVLAVTSLLLAGTILAPIRASALSRFKTNTDASSLKQGIRDGVSVNLEHRDQHMNQENLCYRTNICRQANDGQNTLGNDNSVTGFADQSTTNTTTGNKRTPTPTPVAKSCEQCFTSILNQTQLTTFLNTVQESSIAAVCGILESGTKSESDLRNALTKAGIDVTSTNELIACLKAAGIVL